MQPPQKVYRARTRKRRSHHALKPIQVTVCPNCGNPRMPHAICGHCGYVRPGLSIKFSKEA